MNRTASVTDVARNFSEYINRVAHRGERFVLMRGGKAVAELRPVPVGRRLSDLPEIFASLPHLGPEDAEAFGHDIDAARDELNAIPVRDPWEP
ncbi:MAG TPA: type II toxin-antitoxin system Phd/YefM family antitoxin [Longimicrobiaceae bacterium]